MKKPTTKTPKPDLYFELSDLHRAITYLKLPPFNEQPEWVKPKTIAEAYELGLEVCRHVIREMVRNRAMKALSDSEGSK